MTAGTQRQLTLDIQLRDDATFDNFLTGAEYKPLRQTLQCQMTPSGEPIVYLYGPADAGKSHLLQAACHRGGSGALYLPLAELARFPAAEVLQGVESSELACLDDLDAVLLNDEWEQALFHFFNRARQAGCRLLFSAAAAPRALALSLPDLRSRLSWGVVFQLPAADDERRRNILTFRAERRGLSLTPEVAGYIVHRAPRALGSLLALLERLDAASLMEKRPLSIPFVKQQLGW